MWVTAAATGAVQVGRGCHALGTLGRVEVGGCCALQVLQVVLVLRLRCRWEAAARRL